MRFYVFVAAVMQIQLTCHGFAGVPLQFHKRARGGKPSAKLFPNSPAHMNVDCLPVVATCSGQARMSDTPVKSQQGEIGIGGLKRWDPSAQQAFLQPAFHNKNPVRVAVLLAVVGLTARGSLLIRGGISQFFHMLAFSAWTGSTLWVTFIAGITMFRNMPRQAFGKIQSKLFPAYFQLHLGAIAAIFIVRGCPYRSRAGIALLVSLASTFLNLVLAEPKSTEIMFKRYSLENEDKKTSDEYKKLQQQFGKFHGMSSLLNLVALSGALVYAWDLAEKLPV